MGNRGLYANRSISRQLNWLEKTLDGLSNAELVRLYVEPSVKIIGGQPSLGQFFPT